MTETETHVEPVTETPTRTHRWRRRAGTAVLVVAVGVVSSLTTTWANHTFPDVPTSSPHHADVAWLASSGITSGFGDGTFRPTQPVARQQMATFLRNFNARFTVVSTSGNTTGLSDSIQTGAACPAGRRAIGGGGTISGVDIFMTASYPVADTWFVRWEQQNAGSLGSRTYTVYALCALPL